MHIRLHSPFHALNTNLVVYYTNLLNKTRGKDLQQQYRPAAGRALDSAAGLDGYLATKPLEQANRHGHKSRSGECRHHKTWRGPIEENSFLRFRSRNSRRMNTSRTTSRDKCCHCIKITIPR